jgi:hypothetical protein
VCIKWEGISDYTRDELLAPLNRLTAQMSTHAQDIIAVLKNNGDAVMSVQEVADATGQSYDAKEKMLNRKANEGVILKPARGRFTYVGNLTYTPQIRQAG